MLLPKRMLALGVGLAAVVFAGVRIGPPHATSQPSPSSDPTFRDFNGAVYLSSPEIDKQLGIGWTRQDFSWSSIEPEKGKWSWDKSDQFVQGAHAQSVEVLPILAFTAPWAGQQFSPPNHVEDWEDYVEHVVARYSQPPFNLRYFQIWNEPTREAGFWTGSDQQFIDLIYLRAAKIIHRHQCRVVFGGWPMNGGLPRLNSLLAYHDSWRLTDIVDVHYYGNAAWPPLHDQWVTTGKFQGVWQTEVGFVADTDYLPGLYLWGPYWALESGWTDPNQYKVFWYGIGGTGRDANLCLSTLDSSGKNVLTENGRRLAAINDVLGAGRLALFTQFTTTPALGSGRVEARPMALGFKVDDNRVVIALLLDRATCQRNPSIQVSATLDAKPSRVDLVTVDGEHKALSSNYASGRLDVVVPLKLAGQDVTSSKQTFAYLELDRN